MSNLFIVSHSDGFACQNTTYDHLMDQMSVLDDMKLNGYYYGEYKIEMLKVG